MIGRLDRYVAKTVLGSFVATLLFVMFLWVVLDLLLNMTDYVGVANEQDLGLFQLLLLWGQFHLVSLPLVFVLVAPFVTVIGCMFAVARLMSHNELAPMVFTGRSMRRVLQPCMLMAVISAGAMAVTWEVVLPMLSSSIDELSGSLRKGERGTSLQSLALSSADRRQRLMCDSYSPKSQTMYGVVMVDFGSRKEDLSEVIATSATWNEAKQDWELEDGRWRSGRHGREREWLQMTGATPRMLWLSGRDDKMSSQSYSELLDLIALSPSRDDLIVRLHAQITWPLANILLLLLALPFAVQFERGSRIGRTVLAILICGAYLVVDLTCQNLGQREYLPAVLAAWTPAILFGSLGSVMFGSVRT